MYSAGFQSLMQGETQHTPSVAKPSNSHSTTNATGASDFPQLLIDLVKMLEGKSGVLVKMQLILESMALSYGGKLTLPVWYSFISVGMSSDKARQFSSGGSCSRRHSS